MTKPKLESVAKVLVVNDSNEVLILTIGEYKAHPEKSFTPDLPGGLVDPGESELIAVRRELQEEAGIVLDENAFTLAYAQTEYFEEKHKSVSKFLYVARVEGRPEVTISWEHASYEWAPIEKVLDGSIVMRPFYKEAIEYSVSVGLL